MVVSLNTCTVQSLLSNARVYYDVHYLEFAIILKIIFLKTNKPVHSKVMFYHLKTRCCVNLLLLNSDSHITMYVYKFNSYV